MHPDPVIARRTALAAGLAGAGAVALAACSGGNSSSSSSSTAPEPGQNVATLDAIKVGDSAAAKIDGENVLVYRSGTDSAVCFSATCTHEGCQVQPDGERLACPCHGSMFDAKTGKVLAGPAPRPLPKIAVQVDNGAIVTA
jgi:Rieske Fe-S protein